MSLAIEPPYLHFAFNSVVDVGDDTKSSSSSAANSNVQTSAVKSAGQVQAQTQTQTQASPGSNGALRGSLSESNNHNLGTRSDASTAEADKANSSYNVKSSQRGSGTVTEAAADELVAADAAATAADPSNAAAEPASEPASEPAQEASAPASAPIVAPSAIASSSPKTTPSNGAAYLPGSSHAHTAVARAGQTTAATEKFSRGVLRSPAMQSGAEAGDMFDDDELTPSPPRVTFRKTLKVRNTGTERTRLQFRPLPSESGFRLIAHKKGYIYPGEYETVEIEFTPQSWEHVQETLFVSSSIAPMARVELHGFPALLNMRLPPRLVFGAQTLFQRRSKTIMLKNDTFVDFEYQVTVVEEQPPNCFGIWPSDGVLRANANTPVTITFMPLTLCKAYMVMSVKTNQFGFVPLQCRVTGTGELFPPRVGGQPADTVNPGGLDENAVEGRLEAHASADQLRSVESSPSPFRVGAIAAGAAAAAEQSAVQPGGSRDLASVRSAAQSQQPPSISSSPLPLVPVAISKQSPAEESDKVRGKKASSTAAVAVEVLHDPLHSTDFEEQLQARMDLLRRKDLCRFVCIGEDAQLESQSSEPGAGSLASASDAPVAHLQNGKQQLDACVAWTPPTVTTASQVRIKVPELESRQPPMPVPTERPDQRLSRLFVRAGWTVIYRLRASRRLQHLKSSGGMERPPTKSQSKPAVSYLNQRLARAKPVSGEPQDYRYAPSKTYETPMVDILSFARPMPVDLVTPSYAERMGYKPIKHVPESTTIKIELPGISFDEPSAGKQQVKEERASIKMIHVADPPLASIFNPLPGVETMRMPHMIINDETSPHYIFHSQHAYNLSHYAKMAALETDLKQMCFDMSAALQDVNAVLHSS
ncbi:hypothetical protein BC831DRAFT_453517 [Entophlyctis helioformis]|nr:hypothetical protein BC831DRAFT_453517 [Entophlyctis helioformis]